MYGGGVIRRFSSLLTISSRSSGHFGISIPRRQNIRKKRHVRFRYLTGKLRKMGFERPIVDVVDVQRVIP